MSWIYCKHSKSGKYKRVSGKDTMIFGGMIPGDEFLILDEGIWSLVTEEEYKKEKKQKLFNKKMGIFLEGDGNEDGKNQIKS